ncbi:MAG: hypothetical protein KKB51_07950 [Candidatus Riflebacteria bacterium]|nr:hypothetical protein [Candidatus Riflebacteria bacterium]
MQIYKYKLQLLLTLLAIFSFGHSRATADQLSYLFPTNISLRIADSSIDSAGRLQLSVIIESKLGNLSDLEIYFDSSKDFKVITNLRTLKLLKPQSARKVRVLAIKTGNQPDEIGSWVKVGVKYSPDYQAILQAVNNTDEYPDQFERQRLIDIAQSNEQAKSRYSDAIRFFADKDGSKE